MSNEEVGKPSELVERKMPTYHVELIDNTKVQKDTKTELDKYLESIAIDQVRRIYKGHELPFRSKTIVVQE